MTHPIMRFESAETLQERTAAVNELKGRLGPIVTAARMHLIEPCDYAPLCPGEAALTTIQNGELGNLTDALQVCIMALADRDAEIENLRARLRRAGVSDAA